MTIDTDVGETTAVILLFAVAVLFYFLPGLIGSQKRSAAAIFFFNLMFGFTGVGWIVALVWALTPDPSESNRTREFIPFDSNWLPPPPPLGKARLMWPAVAVGVISWTVLLMAGWWAWNSGLLFTAVSTTAPQLLPTSGKGKRGGPDAAPSPGSLTKPIPAPQAPPTEMVAEDPRTPDPSPTVVSPHYDSSTPPSAQ